MKTINLFPVAALTLNFALATFNCNAQVPVINNGTSIVNSTIVMINGDVYHQNNGDMINSGDINITGNWTNNNSSNNVFSNGPNGWVRLVGATQTIDGVGFTHFNNLELSGTGIKQLNNVDAEIEDTLSLTDREFSTGNNSVFVTSTNLSAVIRTNTMTGGFVSSLGNGALVRNTAANSPYFFPVGSSVGAVRFRPVELTPDNSLNNSYTVRLANTDATIEGFDRNQKQSEIESINPLYYHKINRGAIGSAMATITIYYDAIQDGAYFGIAHWQNTPQWENMLAVASSINYGLSSMSKLAWNDFTTPAYALMKIKNECAEIFVPNAFSPNNDMENDLECVLGNCIQDFYFAIYDRWGEKVFESTDPKNCWDGTYKGKLMNTAVFVYYLQATLNNGETIKKKGNVSLIR